MQFIFFAILFFFQCFSLHWIVFYPLKNKLIFYTFNSFLDWNGRLKRTTTRRIFFYSFSRFFQYFTWLSIQLLSLGLLSPKSNVILERRKKQVKINKKFTDQKYWVKNKKISKTKVKIKMVLNFEMQLNNVVF